MDSQASNPSLPLDVITKINQIESQASNRTLPLDLITEILLRLPVKPLLRFTSVSKPWLARISSPQFVKNHLRLATSDNKDYTHHVLALNYVRSDSKSFDYSFKDRTVRSCLYEPLTKPFDLDYPIDEWSNKLHERSIVGSVHGLICLAINYNDLVLWNPSIRKYKKLLDCSPNWKHGCGALRFDGVQTIYGFGYDEKNDDYKVVITFYTCFPPDQVEVKIYSLKSDSWNNVDGYPCGKLLPMPGKFVNGKLHWPTTPNAIVSFDLANEKWKKVEQPCYNEGDMVPSLGVLGTNLSILCDDGISERDVWVMKEYGVKESWTKMLAIKRSIGWALKCFPPSFMSNEGGVLVYLGSTVFIYNSKDGSLRYSEVNFGGGRGEYDFDGGRGAEIYVESLVRPLST